MSPTAGMILVSQIMPLIAGAVARGAVKPVGCEDVEELTADAFRAVRARIFFLFDWVGVAYD